MIEFKEACAKALDYLKKNNYSIGLSEICDLPDRWIFCGYGGGIYGNTPVTINKESGEITPFSFAIPENYDLYYDTSVSLDIPEEFEQHDLTERAKRIKKRTLNKNERKALQEKLHNPEAVVKCPRCGSEIIYEERGNSIAVECSTKGCIFGGIRGI